MKFNPVIANADQQAAQAPKIGVETRMKYSLKLFAAVGALVMSDSGAGTYAANGAFIAPSTGGNDMQAVLQTANPGLDAPLTAVFSAVLGDGTNGFAYAEFLMPAYAPDQGYHMPQNLAVDLVTASARATAVLTSNNTNVANNDTVVIGGVTYKFKTVLTGAAFEVLIGASADASLTNLSNCINYLGTPGTDYVDNGAPSTIATASAVGVPAAHKITITAIIPGTGANALASTTPVGATLSFGAITFAGGTAPSSPTIRSLGSLVAMTGGASGVELEVFVLPSAADWVEIAYPITKNINPGNTGSVPIPVRYKAAAFTKKGRGGLPSVSLSSNHSTFAMDLARISGQQVSIMLETLDNDRVLCMRTLAETVLSTDTPAGGGNEEQITTASGTASQVAVFV